ncbi:MAG TPA: CbiX/SirB N-terminal domain-containing protein [Bryobacteraceae bacterium]|nr:CbiX/SirB N-terminal domain-containing protein [Bryobacteraceae bacterium]
MSAKPGKTAYIVFAHGSSVASANEAVRAVAMEFGRRSGNSAVQVAFLEGGEPDLAGAVAGLARRGCGRIVVIPYFLTLGTHLQRDLPKLVDQALAAHPGIAIEVTPPLDGHPALLEALADRAAGRA